MRVYVGFGGNLGNVLGAFVAALDGLRLAGVRIVRVSPAYQTVAMVAPEASQASGAYGGSSGTSGAGMGADVAAATDAEQPPYWNAVAALETELTPWALLALLQELESAAGRQRGACDDRWGPRPLDLDILLYGQWVVRDLRLQVPHPGMYDRVFVLRPLVDVAEDAVVCPKTGQTAAAMLAQLPDPDAGVLGIRHGWLPEVRRRRLLPLSQSPNASPVITSGARGAPSACWQPELA